MTKEELIDAIKGMNVLELSDVVKALEQEFGISAAAPVAVAVPSLIPMQLTSTVTEVAVIPAPVAITTESITVQPFASVTVTNAVPAHNPELS